MKANDGKVTASIEEIAHYNMILTEAIFELLAEKDILTGAEVKERVQKVKAETKLTFQRLQKGESLQRCRSLTGLVRRTADLH